MKKKTTRIRPKNVADFCSAMNTLAPEALAQDWDNVGLIAGDPGLAMRKVLLCIDLTHAVVDEALRAKADVVLAYHPPLFKPITSLRADSEHTDAIIFRCVSKGIAVYSTHTALDASDCGTNARIAALCGIKETQPLEYVGDPARQECKLVVFVTSRHVDRVADALFKAGAGHIGDYTKCSYRLEGKGTFFGGASSKPTAGRKGRLESIEETRLETIVPKSKLPDVVNALKRVHPYDEPAFDVYPLEAPPVRGIGRSGVLPKRVTLQSLASKLKRAIGANCVQRIGKATAPVDRAVIVVGAAGSLPFSMSLTNRDVIVTGEIRHHDALTIERIGCQAIALGHWVSERPVLQNLAQNLKRELPGVTMRVSRADCDPFELV